MRANHTETVDTNGTLILTQSDVYRLLDPDTAIEAVERAFRSLAEPGAPQPGVLSMHVEGGAFHTKASELATRKRYFASKTNANFPANPERHRLPTIQGVLILFDGADGRPLAVMDSMSITALRTAAATAVAAKYLAPQGPATVTLVGCGSQAPAQIRMLAKVRTIERLYLVDRNPDRAEQLATEMAGTFPMIACPAAADAGAALRQSGIVITCTTSKRPVLGPGDVAAGAFVAAVGADNPEKSEIAPALMASAAVFTDLTRQCAEIGDLRHAIAANAMSAERVRAELGDVVTGTAPAPTPDEIVVFDSTGVAVQDVAAAVAVYERARRSGDGRSVRFGE